MSVIFGDFQPKTLEEASDYIFQSMDDKDKLGAAGLPGGVQSLHHSLGQAIRNHWGLWNGSDLQGHFKERFQLGHADDMSSLILARVDALRAGEEFDPQPMVDRYKQFWQDQGIDPLTQERSIL